jgi:hypothetical protein
MVDDATMFVSLGIADELKETIVELSNWRIRDALAIDPLVKRRPTLRTSITVNITRVFVIVLAPRLQLYSISLVLPTLNYVV